MDRETYFKKLKNLEKEFHQRKVELASECAYSNNTYNIGDMITDHIGSIRIERISLGLAFSDGFPMLVYEGVEYTKKGVPKKRGDKRRVYASNVKDLS